MEEDLVSRERAGQALLEESLSDVQAARLELSETVKVLAETQKIAGIRSMFWNWDDDRVYSRISEPGEAPGRKDHGKRLSDLLERLPAAERDSVQRALEECRATHSPLFLSFSMPGKDGSNAYFQVRGVVQQGDQGRPVGMIGSVQNVTEQRNLEDQLRQAQKVESLGQFAGGIAHDFNNLLSAMLGFIDLAQESLEESHPAFEDLVEARAMGTRGAKLVKKLLQFSRQETVEMADQDLNEILTGMEGLLSYLLGTAHSLEFHTGETSLPVRADASALEQVVVNLVVNARDAMPEGGSVQVTARKVGLDSPLPSIHGDIPAGDYVMVAVADTGVGIPPTMLTKIFLPFITTKDKDKGTGLGLSVCHGIVTQAGGFFAVQTSSEGTRFSIYLPLVSPS